MRACEALDHGAVEIEAEVLQWESSRGRVRGHRVRLALPAVLLARVRASPAATDGLHAAFASAIGTMSEGDVLVDLELRWAPVGVASSSPSPYRGSVAHPSHAPEAEERLHAFRVGLAEYLGELGLEQAAGTVLHATIEQAGEAFLVRLREEEARDARDVASAVSGLVGAAGRVVVGARRVRA